MAIGSEKFNQAIFKKDRDEKTPLDYLLTHNRLLVASPIIKYLQDFIKGLPHPPSMADQSYCCDKLDEHGAHCFKADGNSLSSMPKVNFALLDLAQYIEDKCAKGNEKGRLSKDALDRFTEFETLILALRNGDDFLAEADIRFCKQGCLSIFSTRQFYNKHSAAYKVLVQTNIDERKASVKMVLGYIAKSTQFPFLTEKFSAILGPTNDQFSDEGAETKEEASPSPGQ